MYGIEGEEQLPNAFKMLRPYFSGILVANNQISFEEGNSLIEDGVADMVTFGRLYISNPDLVERFRNGWEFNKYDQSTAYSNGAEGYIDYPKYKKDK
jgi:N-ethylmaleimide reductase